MSAGVGAAAMLPAPRRGFALRPGAASDRARITHAGPHARFERVIGPLPAVVNPFDPDVIDVWGNFTRPDGTLVRVPAFFFQDFARRVVNGRERLEPNGSPEWRVRFTPTRPGRWQWFWSARTPAGVLRSEPEAFVVTDRPAAGETGLSAAGFVRRSERDLRYLVHDDGTPYFAIGENVAWYGDGRTLDYDRWFARLAEQSANFARLWMPYWAFALEAPATPLGDYTSRLDRAWQLDHVFDLAQSSGLMLMLCLQNHGPFSLAFNSEWAQNPYNAANGGPLTQPREFFTDPTALALFRRRLRYCVARWGYAPQLLAWELWNEVDLTDGYDQNVVAAWHRDMATYLRSLDPNRHLVTTSLALYPSVLESPSFGEIWNTAGLDLTQIHRYTTLGANLPVGDTDVSRDLGHLVTEMLDRHGAPTIVGEYGVNSAGPAETAALDPDGIALHDALWSSALSGAFGTAMTWWWDSYVDERPDVFYPMFGAVARFVADVPWDQERFAATSATAAAPGRDLVVYGLDGVNVRLLWIKNDDHQWNHPDSNPVNGAICDLGRGTHHWNGQWWDTTTGTVVGVVGIRPGKGRITVPPFTGDVALRLTRARRDGTSA
jgi:hypothetical protein